jgi:hypothetical protein
VINPKTTPQQKEGPRHSVRMDQTHPMKHAARRIPRAPAVRDAADETIETVGQVIRTDVKKHKNHRHVQMTTVKIHY